MPHIHTEDGQHDHTVSAFIVHLDENNVPRIMLHMHRKLHKLLQPGGHVELNETPWAAIKHELVEETGFNPDQLKLLQPWLRMPMLDKANLHPFPVAHNTHSFKGQGVHKMEHMHYHTDISYGFVTREFPQDAPLEGESTDIRWLTLAELNALDPEELYSDTKTIATWVLTIAVNQWEQVPTSTYA